MQQSSSPLRNSKHNPPSGHSDGFLGSNCGADLVELGLDPGIVVAVVVQLSKDLHRFIFAVCSNEVAGRLGEEYHSYCEDLRLLLRG